VAQRGGNSLHARLGAGTRPRLPRNPEDPHGRAAGDEDRRARRAARRHLATDDAADPGGERDQARPGTQARRRHRVDPRPSRRRQRGDHGGGRRPGLRRGRWRHRHRPEERARTPATRVRSARLAGGGRQRAGRRGRHAHRAGATGRIDRNGIAPMSRAVIAEDEALLRDALRRLLQAAWPELDVIADCDNGADALDAIATQQPDVAFLDIRMPGLSGLEVAAAAAEASPATQVVFTTAYDQYAIDAFERGAIDYLLKPIAVERLAATVERLK